MRFGQLEVKILCGTGRWIKGEGGDICLYRDTETDKVVGCFLPLYQRALAIQVHPAERVEDEAE